MYLEYSEKSIVFNGEILFETRYTKDVGIRRAGDAGPYAAKDVVFNDKSPCTFDNNTKIMSGCEVAGSCIIFNSVILGRSTIRGNFIIENSTIDNAHLTRIGKSYDFATIRDSKIVSSANNVQLEIYCSSSVFFDISGSDLLLDRTNTDGCIRASGTCASLVIHSSSISFKTGSIILKDYAKLKINKSNIVFPDIIAIKPCEIRLEKCESDRLGVSGATLKMSCSKFNGLICSKGNGSKGTCVNIRDSSVSVENAIEVESDNVKIDITSSTIDEMRGIKILSKVVKEYKLLIDKSRISGNINLQGGTFGRMEIVESDLSGMNLIVDSLLSHCKIENDGSRIFYSNLRSCNISRRNSIGTDFRGRETMSLLKTIISDLVIDRSFCFYTFPFAKSAALIEFKDKTFLAKNGVFEEVSLENVLEKEIANLKKSKDIFPLNIKAEWAIILDRSVDKIFEQVNAGSKFGIFKKTLRHSICSLIISVFNAYSENKNYKDKDLVEQELADFCIIDISQKKMSKLSRDSIFVPEWIFKKDMPYLCEDSAKYLSKFIVLSEIY